MSNKPNNCLAMNMFTSKLKELQTEFNSLYLARRYSEAKILKVIISDISKVAIKYTNESLKNIITESGIYFDISDFCDGMAIANQRVKDNSYCLINTKGEVILTAREIIPSGNNGYFVDTGINDEAYFTDSKGVRIGEDLLNIQSLFGEGFATIKEDDKIFYIDSSYNKVFDKDGYWRAQPFSNGIAGIRKKFGTEWDIINKHGHVIIDEQFKEVGSYSEGLITVAEMDTLNLNKSKWKYIDINGETKFFVPTQEDFLYTYPYPFYNGIARIAYDNNDKSRTYYMFVDAFGKYISDDKFEEAFDFKNGIARVRTSDKLSFNYIDTTGKVLFSGRQFIWTEEFSDDGFMKLKDGDTTKYMDTKGNFYTPAEYNKKQGILETPEDVKEYIEKVEVNK